MTDPRPITDALAELARLNAEAEEIAAAEPAGGALVPVAGTDVDPVSMKRGLAEMRAASLHKQRELREAADRVRAEVDAQLRAMNGVLDPLRKQVARLEEAIETVNLYLGRDEEILTLRDGEPAPAGTPITLRSMVLSMAEETAIDPESQGIDARKIDEFDGWLLADPAHLDQVLPEERGVVVLVPTFQHRDYGDPWSDLAMAKANVHSYWLIRNGDRLFRMDCSLDVGRRLIGSRTEFTDLFYRREVDWHDPQRRTRKVEIKPGTWEWEKAQENADAKTRHYMKIALVLQGLVDRTTVFHPLPVEGLSLLGDAAYQAGHVRLIEEETHAIGTGREPFYEWLRRLNAELRPGMRIVGAFNTSEWSQHAYDGTQWSRGGHSRTSPPNASSPQSYVLHQIEEVNRDGQFVIRYHRTDEVYNQRNVPVPDQPGYVYRYPMPGKAKVRASARLEAGDRCIIPVDLVTVEEMQAYLEARTERHAYTSSFPLLRAAIKAKRDEAAAEEPFRVMLTGRLMADHDGLDEATARREVDDLVSWWKFTNKYHRPLVGEGEHEAKAVRMIADEYAKRLKAAATDDPKIVERLRGLPDVMLVGRARDGGYVALAPEARTVPEAAGPRNVWAHEWTMRPKGQPVERSWVLISGPRAARWRVLWSDERWDGWDRTATHHQHLTDPEIEQLLVEVGEHMDDLCADDAKRTAAASGTTIAATYNHEHRIARVYRLPADPIQRDSWRGREEVRAWDCPGGWKRGPGNSVVHQPAEYLHDREWRPSRRWVTGTDPDRAPWQDEPVVWLDTEQVERGRRALAALAVKEEERERKRFYRRALVTSVTHQWMERAERAAYDRFIEDYADPSLWEGHRKTLTIRLPSGLDDDLTAIVKGLAEQGSDAAGMTVEDAIAALSEPLSNPHDGLAQALGFTFRAPEPDDDDDAPDDE